MRSILAGRRLRSLRKHSGHSFAYDQFGLLHETNIHHENKEHEKSEIFQQKKNSKFLKNSFSKNLFTFESH